MADIREIFGLHAIPFTRELSSRWDCDIFSEVLTDLVSVVEGRFSAALVGPAGVGKTAILRALRDQLPAARYRVHYVKVTSLSKRDLCRELAAVMGLEPTGTYPSLVRKLQAKVEATAFTEGLRPVLLIDEAHDMRPEVLAIMRIITNFEMDSQLVLSLVLAGQPALLSMLGRDDLQAVRQRIAHCATLRLLSRSESASYIEHRMTSAGSRSLPFDQPAMDAIYEISRGNLRAIDTLARKSLEVAARRGMPAVDQTLVTAARALLPS
jgi:type II secretory pathway predicted ATPase ExeA